MNAGAAPGKCESCETVHPPVLKGARKVARCHCRGVIKFPNREPKTGCLAKGAKGAKADNEIANVQRPTKERPILFSGPMVRALLDGSKTQTRRTVNPQPTDDTGGSGHWYWKANSFDSHTWPDGFVKLCPYGAIGDRLWVRESFRTRLGWEKMAMGNLPCLADAKKDPDWCREQYINYAVVRDSPMTLRGRLRPSIFMPRWASRITLEIADVRVERLQVISEEDAMAEGCCVALQGHDDDFARNCYRELWERINGAGTWSKNPWVWVITFKRIETL